MTRWLGIPAALIAVMVTGFVLGVVACLALGITADSCGV